MSLKDKEKFAIILQNEFNDEKALCDIVRKVSLRQHVGFNVATVDGKSVYIIYDVDKKYLFSMATNKKLKLIWKDTQDFYIIDFSTNTKGNIISYLSLNDVGAGKVEGTIMYENVKSEFTGAGKVLIGLSLKGKNSVMLKPPTLDDVGPYTYERFYIYYRC